MGYMSDSAPDSATEKEPDPEPAECSTQ